MNCALVRRNEAVDRGTLAIAPIFVSCYRTPDANPLLPTGFPNAGNRSRRNCANGARRLVNIVGGCCAPRRRTSKKSPKRFAPAARVVPQAEPYTRLTVWKPDIRPEIILNIGSAQRHGSPDSPN